jgi:transcription initiation factor TFIID subunit 6
MLEKMTAMRPECGITQQFFFLFLDYRFGDDYATLKARVLRTLCDAAGADKSLATQYGGFVGITLFGPKAINAFLLPLAMDYWNQWEKKLDETNDLEQRLELQMCKQAMLVRCYLDIDQ